MSEAVKNLLKEVGVDFKTDESIDSSEEKNEKIHLAEEKRRSQKRRNKESKHKHSIFESKKATNKTTELLKGVGVDFAPQETIEEKIEKFEEIIKEDLHSPVEHIEKPVHLKTIPEEEILLQKMTAEPYEFPNAVVDAIDGMFEGKFYLDKPDLPEKDLIYPTVNRISEAIKEPLIEISPFRQELEQFRKSITEQIGRTVSLSGGSGSGEVLLQRMDDVDDSNKGHGTTLAWSTVTKKYEAADPDINAGISLEDDTGDEIIINATASGGADEGGKITQEDNTRIPVTANTTVSSMSLSTSTLTLTDSADDTVTVDLSALVLDNDAIDSEHYTDGSIDTAHLADDVVTEAKMAGGLHTIYLPSAAMRPTSSNGCAGITDVETTSGRPDMQVLDFDASSDEHAQFQIAMPKSWNESTITAKFFWCSTATDTDGVSWGIQGVACSDSDTIDVVYGTAIVVDDANLSAAEDMCVSATTSAITIAGTPAEGDMCFFRVFRDVSDANDTAAEDARLVGVQLYFTTNTGGDT